MSDKAMNAGEQAGAAGDDEISLLDLALVLVRHKRLLVRFPAVVALVAVVATLLTPNVYQGTVTVLPPQSGGSIASSILAQLGGLGGAAGGLASSLGLKNPGDLYVGMLESRTIADKLIQRFDLLKVYDQEYLSDARKELDKATDIKADSKSGIITIDVYDEDPQRAADMANAYVEELFNLTKTMAITDASRRRKFFEQRLNQAKSDLTKAELAAKQAMDKGGLAVVDAQALATSGATAQLRAQIAVQEVLIEAMRGYAAEHNPDLMREKQQLAALKAQLAKLEGNGGGGDSSSGGAGLGNVQLLRDVKYYQTVYELLAQQYELAKIDEAKDPDTVQVMDRAVVPDKKAKPKRTLIVILATMASLFVAVLWAFVREAMEKARQEPETASRLEALRRHLAWRR